MGDITDIEKVQKEQPK